MYFLFLIELFHAIRRAPANYHNSVFSLSWYYRYRRIPGGMPGKRNSRCTSLVRWLCIICICTLVSLWATTVRIHECVGTRGVFFILERAHQNLTAPTAKQLYWWKVWHKPTANRFWFCSCVKVTCGACHLLKPWIFAQFQAFLSCISSYPP